MAEESVWKLEKGEVRKPGTIHIAVFALLIGVGAVAGTFGSLAIPLGYGVTGFWPGVAVQAVGSIWFGLWGVLAGGLFPFISNTLAGAPLYVSVAYFPSNAIQGLLPRLAFKYLNCDPRLKSAKDYVVFIVFGVILNNILGAAWAVTALQAIGLITVESVPLFFSGWTIGNGVPALVFGVILLKALSPMVVRHRSFCKGWWA
ncbi:MAG: hypothetical protein DRJ51_09135 [Thermoprotei archaeon]|nr:MAG: hypothetical protein DRJ51_09135 [Thermoprotei archaeon]